jgi:hypothetical protein
MSVAIPNLHNLGGRKLGLTVPFPRKSSPLAVSVGVVVGACSKEKMGGVTACWNVTAMQHTQPLWDRTVGQHPSNTTRSQNVTADVDLTVPVLDTRRQPQPTAVRVRVIDPTPEPLNVTGGKLSTHSVLLTLDAVPGGVNAPARFLCVPSIAERKK